MEESTLLAALAAVTAVAWASGALLQWLTLRKQERLIDDLKHLAAPTHSNLPGWDVLPGVQPGHVRGRGPQYW
jgi:hypothetical protein